MKKILFACMLTAIGVPAFAQWTYTTSGNPIYTTTNSVGIGTTAPQSSLTINPSVTGGSSVATSFMVGNGSTVLPNTAGAYLYPFELNHTYTSGHSGKLQFAPYRRFTTASGSEWYGAAYRLQYMYDGTGATGSNAYVEIGQSDPNYIGNGFISLGTGGFDRLSIGQNGNVGIGTTNPTTHGGYFGISVNNANNGGFIEFLQAGTQKGYISGDSNGLTLLAPAGNPVHIWSNGVENMTVLSNGNVGIGQTTPVARLQVNGTTLTGGGNANLNPAGSYGDITFLGNTGTMLLGYNRSGGEGESDFIANRGSGGSNGGFAFYDYSNPAGSNPGVQTELMRVRSSGQVLIGVNNFATSPQYSSGVNMLAVAGGIETDAITVKLQSAPWPDYVFKPKYRLPDLSAVKAYIDEYHHLPEMPSEADIAKNGQNLGEMNKLLVKKVEELTLYLIEKDKQLSEDKQTILKQQSQLDSQRAQTAQITDQLKLQQQQLDDLVKQVKLIDKVRSK